MKKRIIRMSLAVVIGLGMLAAVVWLLSLTLGSRQTLYQGKPLFYWVQQLKSHDPAATNEAFVVLNTEIIPQLTNVLFHDNSDSNLRLRLVETLNDLPGISIYFISADGRRGGAANDLGQLGPAAKAAIPALIQALNSQDKAVRGPAAAALGKIHEEPGVVIPLLIKYLDDNDLNDEAAAALGDFGTLAKEAVPKLVPLLKIPDKDLHAAVVGALKKIDPDAAAKAGIK